MSLKTEDDPNPADVIRQIAEEATTLALALGMAAETYSIGEAEISFGLHKDWTIELTIDDEALVATLLPDSRDYTGVPPTIRWGSETGWLYGPAEIGAFFVRATND